MHETHKISLRELLAEWNRSVYLWRQMSGATPEEARLLGYLVSEYQDTYILLRRFGMDKPGYIAYGGVN